MTDSKPYVLFLCTGNSARSIIAEAITNQQFGKYLRAVSAGAGPKPAPHEMTLSLLARQGLSTEGLRSKSSNEFVDEPFDLVITLCDNAASEPCPTFPGPPAREHWSLPDPPAADPPEDMFEAVFKALEDAIGLLAHGTHPSLAARAREARVHLNRRFTPRMI
ncbi:MAG: arsenate reductase ArsC [Planctomycetes bacterium]|nr:arsenate reductase ArsC [Planctomycetota bacterium]